MSKPLRFPSFTHDHELTQVDCFVFNIWFRLECWNSCLDSSSSTLRRRTRGGKVAPLGVQSPSDHADFWALEWNGNYLGQWGGRALSPGCITPSTRFQGLSQNSKNTGSITSKAGISGLSLNFRWGCILPTTTHRPTLECTQPLVHLLTASS